jgi:hypothetical protein
LIYLTQTRLMLESERTVHDRAIHGEEIPRRVCSQLLSDSFRYALWHARHENRMGAVAAAKRRESQILTLRSLSVQQVHRTALVRYFRDQRITGKARDQTLREFYGVTDARDAAVLEHRNYVIAASSQLCAADLLELVGDRHGLDLVRRYEAAYGQFFSMFCDRSRAAQNRAPYLLDTLIPEVRDTASRIRRLILEGERLPPRQISFRPG